MNTNPAEQEPADTPVSGRVLDAWAWIAQARAAAAKATGVPLPDAEAAPARDAAAPDSPGAAAR